MTIKAYNQGPLALSEIQTEFGGPNTNISMYSYLAGGGRVPAGTNGFPGPSGIQTSIASAFNISINGFYGASASAYSIVPSATSVNEGATISFEVTTMETSNGTLLAWEMTGKTGDINPSDFVAPEAIGPFQPLAFQSGTVAISGNAGSFDVIFTADQFTDGVDTFQIRIGANGGVGPWYAISATVTVNDISQSAALYTFDDVISSDIVGYDLRVRAMTPFVGSNGATAWDGTSILGATITNNANVISMTIPSLPAGSSAVTLTNNGIIAGAGGGGGQGGSVDNLTLSDGAPGGSGGIGLIVSWPTNVYNNGTIGGGGGGGSAFWDTSYSDTPPGDTGGGGGGG